MPGFGAWPTVLFEVLPNGLWGGQPVPADFDAFDLSITKKSADIAGGETTEFGSPRYRNQFRGEILEGVSVCGLFGHRKV